jgi:hypothetical protein
VSCAPAAAAASVHMVTVEHNTHAVIKYSVLAQVSSTYTALCSRANLCMVLNREAAWYCSLSQTSACQASKACTLSASAALTAAHTVQMELVGDVTHLKCWLSTEHVSSRCTDVINV